MYRNHIVLKLYYGKSYLFVIIIVFFMNETAFY